MSRKRFPLKEFNAKLIRNVVIQQIEKIFAYKSYETADRDALVSTLTNRVLSKIAPEGKGPYKYITHITIFPKSSGPIDSFSNNYWNQDTDGLVVVDYENNNIHILFILWGIKSDT